MSTPRQQARVQINRIIDEMIADLHKIKRHTLHMDTAAVGVIANRAAHQYNQMIAIYDVLDVVVLPPDKKIITPGEKELF